MTDFGEILSVETGYGFFINPSKCTLHANDIDVSTLHSTFIDTSVRSVEDSVCILGAPVESDSYVERFIRTKVTNIAQLISRVTDAGQSDIQVAYTCLTRSLQYKWSYIQRVCRFSAEWFEPLVTFIKSLFCELTKIEQVNV
ncbi:hypothetical protein GJ496_006642 [Pomphorhynchus laevis]|nr:hypothetical protein GJ496_006642 [Pomphorhynchus laevis]